MPSCLPVELWGRVVDELPLASMLDLSLTCKAFRYLVFHQIPSNIRSRYRAFVRNVDGLQQVMDACHAVACGSFVASFVSGASHWEPQNLDFVLVGGPPSLAIFSEFLLANGYEEPIVPFEAATMTGLSSIHGYSRRHIFHRYSDNAQISLILCTQSSTAFVLVKFYSTLSFQFITSRYFCCAYPSLTLFDVAIINPHVQHEAISALLWERYDKRGYDHWTWSTRADRYAQGRRTSFHCPHMVRTIGDSGCLIVPLTHKDTFTPRREFLRQHGDLEFHGLRWVIGGHGCPVRCGCSDPLAFQFKEHGTTSGSLSVWDI